VGRRNHLVEGVSGTGKTSVCDELQRRGYHAIHGDRDLAYQASGDDTPDGIVIDATARVVDKILGLTALNQAGVAVRSQSC
jgi:broad-specificity NMP kinase